MLKIRLFSITHTLPSQSHTLSFPFPFPFYISFPFPFPSLPLPLPLFLSLTPPPTSTPLPKTGASIPLGNQRPNSTASSIPATSSTVFPLPHQPPYTYG